MNTSEPLLDHLLSTQAMNAVFSPPAQLRAMTRFEWALAVALETAGAASGGTADVLKPFIEEIDGTFDFDRLRVDAVAAGNIAIPFVKQLTEAVQTRDEKVATFIHLGATSQDVLDTALVLQLREALDLLSDDLSATLLQCKLLAYQHAETVMVGRTWLQQGPPVTLGLKIAGWAGALSRHRERMRELRKRALTLQFGGAVGTLASLGDHGAQVSAVLAERLGLAEPPMPWHTHRDSLAEVASFLGLLTGTLGKIARDISLLMQTEIAEVLEPNAPGRGGSSTMPHKRNPVGSVVALAAAIRVPALVATMLSAMVQEHERGLGGWHAEWETLPEIFRLTAGSLSQVRETLEGLQVRPEAMQQTLAKGLGLAQAEAVSTALALTMGRPAAHELVERASHRAIDERKSLLDILSEMPEVTSVFPAARLRELLDPSKYLGSTKLFIDRTLKALEA